MENCEFAQISKMSAELWRGNTSQNQHRKSCVKFLERNSYLNAMLWTAIGKLEVDELDSRLLTRLRFLTFCIFSTSEVYEKKVYESIARFKDVRILKMIPRWGGDKTGHDGRLQSLLGEIRQTRPKLSEMKYSLEATEVNFLGHVFSNRGVKADPRKPKPY